MENKDNKSNYRKYLAEHPETKRKLKIAGWIILPIGGVLTLVGFIDFFVSINNSSMPGLFFLLFLGLPMIGLGATLLRFGYLKEVGQYIAGETAPIAKDVANYMLDGTRDELVKTVDALKGNQTASKVNVCARCGAENPEDALYCSRCGSKIVLQCPYCGKQIDDGASFCSYCGKRIQ